LRDCTTDYRSLDPAAPLFLGSGSKGFTFRESEKGGMVYRQYAPISRLYSKLLDQLWNMLVNASINERA
jgi:hypothetical protein